jgi:hypothetical protein
MNNINPSQTQYYHTNQLPPPVYPDAPAYPGYDATITRNPTNVHQQNGSYPYPPPQNTNHNAYNTTCTPQVHAPYNQSQPPPPPPPKKLIEKSKNIQQNIGSTSVPTTVPELYHCEPCSVSFPTKAALDAHSKSHIKCKKCSFVGSKKVVSAHYKSKHGEYAGRGLKSITLQYPGSRQVQRFKICVGNHPDDIKAWIEERKKRFPTRERVLQRQEKLKRNREEGALGVSNDGIARESKRLKAGVPVNHEKGVKSSDPPFSSISTLVAGYGSSSDEDDTPLNKSIPEKPSEECPGVAEEEKNSNTNQAHSKDHTSNYKSKQCRFFLRNGSCKNGDNCTYIHDITQHEAFKANAETRKRKQSQRDRARNEAKREMNLITTGKEQVRGAKGGQTLLRKLLQNDIRRERSLCLQLLRYIADCNYLQGKREVKSIREDA